MTQTPPEPEPAPEVPAPDYTLRADGCAAGVYCHTENEDALRVEPRCYVVSDGVTATSCRASGDGVPCFFSRTLAVSGTLRYHDAAQGSWVSLPLAEGTFASPVVYLALSDGTGSSGCKAVALPAIKPIEFQFLSCTFPENQLE